MHFPHQYERMHRQYLQTSAYVVRFFMYGQLKDFYGPHHISRRDIFLCSIVVVSLLNLRLKRKVLKGYLEGLKILDQLLMMEEFTNPIPHVEHFLGRWWVFIQGIHL